MTNLTVTAGITLGMFVVLFGMMHFGSYRSEDRLVLACQAALISLALGAFIYLGARYGGGSPADPAPCYPGYGC